LSFDKSDDDNERDPFTFRYARPDSLQHEYNWSDRDQRHRLNAWTLIKLPAGLYMDNRLSYYSLSRYRSAAVPAPSVLCASGWPAGNVGGGPQLQRRHVLQRNTLRKDNEYFSIDVRLSRPFNVGAGTVKRLSRCST